MATSQTRSKATEAQDQEASPGESEQAATLGEDKAPDLQQRIDEAVQPMVANLQQHISETVQQQLQGSGARATADGHREQESDRDALSSTGEWVQHSYESFVQTLQRVWEWILEMMSNLGEKIAEMVGELVGMIVQRAIRSAF